MITKKQLKVKLWAYKGFLAILLLAGAVGVGVKVDAFTSREVPPASVIEHADVVNVNQAVQAPQDSPEQVLEPTLGAVASADNLPNRICQGSECSYSITGDLKIATDTLFAIATPFLKATTTASEVVVTPIADLINGMGQTGATTTVSLARIYITSSSPAVSWTIVCGGSIASTTAPTYNLLSSDTITSSTVGVVENGIASSQGANIGGGSIMKSQLGPTYPWFVCKARPVGDFATYGYPFSTNASNTAFGKIQLRFSRTRF